MDKSDLKVVLDQFRSSVDRFREALQEDIKENDLFLDGSIQRFEFTFETAWKTLQRFLRYEGLSATSPREVLKLAFKKGWIDPEETWLQMIDDRNKTLHTYKGDVAMEIYGRLGGHLTACDRLIAKLQALHA